MNAIPVLLALALATPAAPSPALPACEGAAAERAALEAEKAEIGRALSNIAMGRAPKKKRKVSGGDVARGAAGAAASVLLPFPLGMLANAGAGAAKSGKKKGAAPEGPNVAAMIEREREIGVRLIALRACG